MSRRLPITALSLLMVVVIASQDSPAQEPVKPGPEHAVLQEAAGSWEATVKMPDGSEAKGSSKATMECGGLWLISDFRMAFGGAEFQGRGIDGYDADKKKFVSVWVDSMSTAPMLFEGDYDRSSKTLTMTGSGKGPDGKPAKFKSLAVMKEKDRQTFKMFLIGPDGNETLMMTIEYQRKK